MTNFVFPELFVENDIRVVTLEQSEYPVGNHITVFLGSNRVYNVYKLGFISEEGFFLYRRRDEDKVEICKRIKDNLTELVTLYKLSGQKRITFTPK